MVTESLEKSQRRPQKQPQVVSPKVCIVIVNWNGLDNTVEGLNSLRKLDYPNCEVIVVDNASTDGSADEISRNFPEVTLMKSDRNAGWGGGNNLGLRHALTNGASYVWFLNNDLIVEKNTLSRLVQAAEKTSGATLVSPILYYYSTRSKIQHCGSEFDWENYEVRNFNDLDKAKSVNRQNFWLWFTAILMKREVVEKVGYFDEKYFVYFDDMDYASRAISAGCRCKLEPTAKVYHRSHSVDLGGIRNAPLHYFYYTTRNEYWFWRSRSSGFRKVLFFRTYLARVIRKLAFYDRQGWDDIVEACLDGLYCGVRNIGGAWDKSIKMPVIIKKSIMRHPYFWVKLFELNAGKIIDRVFGRKKRLAPER